MGMNSIDAKGVQKAFLAAAKGLEANKEWINQLNVFPVPDGDTGTNMSMTIMAAAREVAAVEKPDMETVAKAISSGSLRGARGNSGVILSQLFRGFTKEIKTSDQITTEILANSFVRATETAYKAVMKPKEGTILTVARGMADKAVELAPQIQDIVEFADQVIAHGDYVLSQTPEMLPVLKQAGVVDSGGQGLMQVLKGARDGLLGKEPDIQIEAAKTVVTSPALQDREQEAIQFGYCTEFIINLEKEYSEKTEDELKSYLESIGDSIVVVSDDDIVKVHVHTNHPGLAFEKALTYGSLSRMKVDNMREEHEEKLLKEMELEKQQPRKKSGFIAVSIGDGLGEIFKGIGADYLIEGGQTMNPSTEDMLKAIEQVNADTVFIFPNNKNIILAAEQAKSLVEDKNIVVIPSKTIPQGITALINYLPELSPEENEENMTREMGNVKTGQITYAVRSTVIDGIQIEEGDIMGIGDNGILTSDQSVETAAVNTLKALTDDSSELITIYYGCDVSEEEADRVLSLAEKTCPQCEIELHSGGQPVYYYLISVE